MSDRQGFDQEGRNFGSEDSQFQRSGLFPLASEQLRVTIGFVCESALTYGHGPGLSHIKLQKLLYYMQGFCVGKMGMPCFTENVEAWRLGPVVREVWYECKGFGSDDLPIEEFKTLFRRGFFENYQISMMNWVYGIRGYLSSKELVERTHKERPWIKAWRRGRGGIIPLHSLAGYFYKVTS